jgi:sulfoxide reductase heme-binding subunit YedZ
MLSPLRKRSLVSAAERRYRYFYKPLLFASCMVPFVWVAGGIAGLHGFDLGVEPVRRVLGIFGKTTLNLLLITLAVTPLRHISGNANLLRLRRMLGVFAFSYALAHFLIYLGPFRSFSWPEITRDLTRRPYIILGFSALLLLLPLAITSTKAMMRRLKQRWQTLHRLIYIIGIMGVWHFWWQVKKDIHLPLTYAAMLAVLLLWRPWKRRPAFGLWAVAASGLTARLMGAGAASSSRNPQDPTTVE